MGFNIRDFSARLNQHGVQRGNLYKFRITPPVGILGEVISNYGDMVGNSLEYYCRSVELPAFDVTTFDIQHQGLGTITRRPQTLDFPVLATVFNVDADMKVVKYFHRWSQLIINYDRSSGNYGNVNGALPFELGYKEEYATTMSCEVYDTSGTLSYRYEFSGAYPVNVGSTEVAWANNDEVLTIPVGFTYDTLKVSGAKLGEPARLGDRITETKTAGDINEITNDARQVEENVAPQKSDFRRLNRSNGSRFARRVQRGGS